jgi:probable HAF family extracellular repeat protein
VVRLLLAGVLVAVALAAPASPAPLGQARWVITDLCEGSVTAINEQGSIVGVCAGRGAVLWQNGKVTDLGSVASSLQTEPLGINAKGQIVGRAVRYGPIGNTDGVVESVPFLWQNGRMTRLGTAGLTERGNFTLPQPVAINDQGQVIGFARARNGESRALLWQGGHTITLWRSLQNATPAAINNRGQIVGSRGDRALLWANGRVRDLGNLGGKKTAYTSPSAWATDLNLNGQVVGTSRAAKGTPHPPYHAFLWEKGKMTDLGVPKGDMGSEAWGINERGQVLGRSYDKNGKYHLFVWDKGRITPLRGLGGTTATFGAPQEGRGNAINDRGQIIVNAATYESGSIERALVWENNHVTTLPTLGGATARAYAINNHGQIIGTSTTKNGQQHAVLWMQQR